MKHYCLATSSLSQCLARVLCHSSFLAASVYTPVRFYENQFNHSFFLALSLLVCEHPKGVNAQGAISDKIVACRVASNYHFAKLMEIAESVPTGRV